MRNVEYLNGLEERISFYIEEYQDNGEISLITDYETAIEMYDIYGDEEYEDYTSINLQSDVFGYLVDIIKGELFVIEPLRRNNKYFTIETNKLIIEEEFFNDELERFLNCEDVVIVKEECDEECECGNCKMCCDCDMECLEDDEEFTVEDLCSYVLINKLDNCKNIQEEIEVLKELYEIGFDDGYDKAIQDDVEEKLDYLNGDFEE